MPATTTKVVVEAISRPSAGGFSGRASSPDQKVTWFAYRPTQPVRLEARQAYHSAPGDNMA